MVLRDAKGSGYKTHIQAWKWSYPADHNFLFEKFFVGDAKKGRGAKKRIFDWQGFFTSYYPDFANPGPPPERSEAQAAAQDDAPSSPASDAVAPPWWEHPLHQSV